MIGPSHIKNSSGMYLNIKEAENLGSRCYHSNCYLKYEDHTSDNVAFLYLIRNSTTEDVNKALKILVDDLGKSFIDGFAFVKSEFEIITP